MLRKTLLIGCAITLLQTAQIAAHCQMPCGIYHDDMVFDQIDQYVETMYKGISVMNDSKFNTVRDKNEFVRWVLQKERASDEAAQLITTYFLQQKIKPGEEDTIKRLTAAHKLLFMLVVIKQNTDLKFVEDFSKEWDQFKVMFHREGYECELEKIKLKKQEAAEAALKGHDHDHLNDHDHSHDHDHGTPINKK